MEPMMKSKPTIFTNGVFDLFHSGHRYLLTMAMKRAGILIVGINSDASVKRLKGGSRPVHTQVTRLDNVVNFLSSLRSPNPFYVYIFSQDTPEQLIHIYRPNVLLHGNDAPHPWPGEEFVRDQLNGEIWSIDRVHGMSTTGIIEGTT